MDVVVANGDTELEKKTDTSFYKNAASYWSHIPPTVDGMLGGFGFVSSIDIQGSSNFLKRLFKTKNAPGRGRALDCGAGIGRISKYLLLERFELVDLVEQNPAFLEQASSFIGANKHLGNLYCSGLQDFTPDPHSYDVIWCQWVLGHLMDEDLTHFLQKCKHGLKKNGVIVAKENVTRDGQTEIDTTDSSVIRSLSDLRSVLESAGLKCISVHRQERFPRMLYPVYIFALRPSSASGKGKKDLPDEVPALDETPTESIQEQVATEDKEPCAINNSHDPDGIPDGSSGRTCPPAGLLSTSVCEEPGCSSEHSTIVCSDLAEDLRDLNESLS